MLFLTQVLTALVVGLSFAEASGVPTIHLSNTKISGIALPSLGQEYFFGIPYAEAPVGDLRFAPPVLKLSPDGESFNASAFGPACPQFGIAVDAGTVIGEDCLSVNVFRPEGLDATKQVPVLVWVYGGAFINGMSSQSNGCAIVSQSVARGTPIIFVSLNYRTGPLGYPQGSEAEHNGALNLGIKDVLAALTWVQHNIGAFGGDKDKVTVWGASAGSINIGNILLDPTFNLARAAILESGFAASLPMFDAAHHEQDWQHFVAAVPECAGHSTTESFGCLRTANVTTIINAGNDALGATEEEFAFVPVIDGPGGIVPDLPSVLYSQGHFAKVALLTGQNTDEGTFFVTTTINSSTEVREWVHDNYTSAALPMAEFAADVDRILELYPDNPALGAPFGTGNNTFGLSASFKRQAAIEGDMGFHSKRREIMQVYAESSLSSFGYLFTEPQPQLPPELGVTHTTEIPFVFGEFSSLSSPAQVILSHNTIDYWVSFVNGLNPNDGHGNKSRLRWPQYTLLSKVIMELNSENETILPDTYRETQVAFIIDNSLAFRH